MALKNVNIKVIPTGGVEADRVSFSATDFLFGDAVTDKKNNILKKGDKTYKLDSLQWDVTDVAPIV
jgi:hypothetical protein